MKYAVRPSNEFSDNRRPKAARLVFTNDKFVYSNLPREGFPVILGEDMRPLWPAHDFLMHNLLGRGRSLDEKTWEAYGRRLWDYFAVLAHHDIAWDYCPDPNAPGKGPVATYKAWSLKEDKTLGKMGIKVSTLNARLAIIVEFYEWAQKKGYIECLPFGYKEHRVRHEDFLMHIRNADATVTQADVFNKEWDTPPEYLTKEQIKACLVSKKLGRRTEARLLFNLMWRVGLRSVEARSFPLKYVFDPKKRSDCHPNKLIRISLSPSDMGIKFDKPRQIDIPYSLMDELYAYTLHERNARSNASMEPHRELILTVSGRPYSKDDVVDMMSEVSAQVGFRATALMLRHSYAVHMLAFLRSNPEYKGEPLLYVRDRLGHSDVQTTMIYLEQINHLASEVVLVLEDEYDRLFGLPEMSIAA